MTCFALPAVLHGMTLHIHHSACYSALTKRQCAVHVHAKVCRTDDAYMSQQAAAHAVCGPVLPSQLEVLSLMVRYPCATLAPDIWR